VKRFSDYVSEHRERGGNVSTLEAQLVDPVLIQRSPGDGEAAERRVYKTDHSDASLQEVSESRRPAKRDDEALDLVIVLVKRKDAPFTTHIGIGRANNVDVCLPLRGLSKFHAYFLPAENGGMAIADASSKNGTWVDGRRLLAKAPVLLRDGSPIRLGPYEFMFLSAAGFCRAVAGGSLEEATNRREPSCPPGHSRGMEKKA
jgi:hypothetical protein